MVALRFSRAPGVLQVGPPVAAAGPVSSLWLYYHDPTPGSEVLRAYSYEVGTGALALVNENAVPTTIDLAASEWSGRILFKHCSFGENGEIAFDFREQVIAQQDEWGFIWFPVEGGYKFVPHTSTAFGHSSIVWSGGAWHFIRAGLEGGVYGGGELRKVVIGGTTEAVSALDPLATVADVHGINAAGSDGTYFYAWHASGYIAFLLDGTGAATITDGTPERLYTCDPADPGEMWLGGVASGPGGQIVQPPSVVARYPDEAPWRAPAGMTRLGRSHYKSGKVLFSWHGFNVDDECDACEIRIHGSTSATSGEVPDVSFDAPADPAGGSLRPWAAAIRTVAS